MMSPDLKHKKTIYRQTLKARGICVECGHVNDRKGMYCCSGCARINFLRHRIKRLESWFAHYKIVLPNMKKELAELRRKKHAS
jgi:hypothetical protein